MAFIASPFSGDIGLIIGPKALFNIGSFGQAICCILMGFLAKVDDLAIFIGISCLLRYY